MTLRAAASGSIDFSNCDIHDPTWKAYYRMHVRAQRLEDHHEILKLQFSYYTAVSSNARADLTSNGKDILRTYHDLEAVRRPWKGLTEEERQARLETDFKNEWEKITGFSPDDADSLETWESQLREHLENRRIKDEEQQEQYARQMAKFNEQVAAIRKKRMKGR